MDKSFGIHSLFHQVLFRIIVFVAFPLGRQIEVKGKVGLKLGASINTDHCENTVDKKNAYFAW